jgi:Mn2+/Fe2+ NRAMP family transporter
VAVGPALVSLMAANALNVAAGLVAVGSGMTLLRAGPTWLWALVGGVVVTGLVILGSVDRIARVVTLLCLALLVYVAVPTRPPTGQLLHRLPVPYLELNASYLTLLVALSGITISPSVFVSRSAHRIEDLRNEPARGRKAVLLGKRSGLSRLPGHAPVFYGMVVLGTIGGAAVTLTHVDPVQFFVISAFVKGITAAPFLVLVMPGSGNRKRVGEHVNASWPRPSAGSPPPLSPSRRPSA